MNLLGALMNNKIVEYTIEHNQYKLKVLNIGATITEYSLDGHNICLSYRDIEAYRENELYAGSIVGRTAGRIKDGCVGVWQLPKNYLQTNNHHGNDLHLAFYDVQVGANYIELTLSDPEGDYPGNAQITVRYTLNDEGLCQEITANSDQPTLFNFTNHSYFNLDLGTTVLDHNLQIDSDEYGYLDKNMFVQDVRPVTNTAFDFQGQRTIGSSRQFDDEKQFAITKFIDHPFKLNGKLHYSNDQYQLTVETNSDYVVIYTANFLGECKTELKNGVPTDFGAICFETQKLPGDKNLVTNFYSQTSYQLCRV